MFVFSYFVLNCAVLCFVNVCLCVVYSSGRKSKCLFSAIFCLVMYRVVLCECRLVCTVVVGNLGVVFFLVHFQLFCTVLCCIVLCKCLRVCVKIWFSDLQISKIFFFFYLFMVSFVIQNFQ